MPDQQSSRPDVALAMNASFLGFFAHAGFLAGLEELAVRPGKIAGASAGAIAGALHATGHDAETIRSVLFDPDLEKHFIEKRSLLRVPGMIFGRPGPRRSDARAKDCSAASRTLPATSRSKTCATPSSRSL